MNKPQKHAEFIKAWADGAEIEYKSSFFWVEIENPSWTTDIEYRIKPREFPSSMTMEECFQIYTESPLLAPLALKRVADEAVKRYILEQENEK